jgi:hypothetical protein
MDIISAVSSHEWARIAFGGPGDRELKIRKTLSTTHIPLMNDLVGYGLAV